MQTVLPSADNPDCECERHTKRSCPGNPPILAIYVGTAKYHRTSWAFGVKSGCSDGNLLSSEMPLKLQCQLLTISNMEDSE